MQEHLQENFGLRDKRSLIAQQLEKIRDAIIRYSDLAAKRRAVPSDAPWSIA